MLDWSESLQSDDPYQAFILERLPDLLHALNIALLSSYGFAPAPPAKGMFVPHGRVNLDISDLGGAAVIERARTCAGVVIVAIHDAVGASIVSAANAELYRLVDAISQAVARAR